MHGPPPRATHRAIGVGDLDDDALHARLAAERHVGDPLADAAVVALRAAGGRRGWRLLDDALIAGAAGDPLPAALPEAVRDLLDAAATIPPWLDLPLVRAGASAHWRVGFLAQTMALTYGSLAFGYQYADLARPLVMTGRLERMVPRRISETARWALAATTPGAMAPWHDGWAATVRVRIVHALVRAQLGRRADWRPAWGVPISSAAALATGIGGFLVVPHDAMADLGVRATDAEREARTALWRWISHVMGAPTDLLPASWAEAVRLVDALEPLMGEPIDGSAELLDALTGHGAPSAQAVPGPPGWALQRLSTTVGQALTRRWMGRERADALGVGGAGFDRLVPLVRPLSIAAGATTATGVLGSDERVARLQIAMLGGFLDRIGGASSHLAPADVA
jgi:hypothetical protein